VEAFRIAEEVQVAFHTQSLEQEEDLAPYWGEEVQVAFHIRSVEQEEDLDPYLGEEVQVAFHTRNSAQEACHTQSLVRVEDLDPYWAEAYHNQSSAQEACHTRSLVRVEDLDPYWTEEAFHTRNWEQKEAHAHTQNWEVRVRVAWEVQNWISLAVACQEPPCGRVAYYQVLAVHRDHPLALEHLQEEQNQEACCRTVKRARLSV
jgi:hypothetical protein